MSLNAQHVNNDSLLEDDNSGSEEMDYNAAQLLKDNQSKDFSPLRALDEVVQRDTTAIGIETIMPQEKTFTQEHIQNFLEDPRCLLGFVNSDHEMGIGIGSQSHDSISSANNSSQRVEETQDMLLAPTIHGFQRQSSLVDIPVLEDIEGNF